MNLRTERSDMLPSSFLGLQSRAPSTATSTSLLRPEDKESIYTFSDNCSSDNDEQPFLEHDKLNSKYGTRLNMPSNTPTDRNLNEPARSAFKDNVRTYGKKKPSSSAGSADTRRRQQTASSTIPTADNSTTSYSAFPLNQPGAFSPPPSSDAFASHPTNSNGSTFAEPSSSSPSSSSSKPRKKKDPSGGKPKAFAMAIEKMNQAASSNAIAKPKPRGGRKKALVAMYQSQLSDNTVGIKIRLKKSLATTIRKVEVSTPAPSSAPSSTSSATPMPSSSTSSRKKKASASPSTSSLAPTPSTSKSPRKRSRKSKHKETSDSDDSEYERKRPRNSNAAAGAQRRANRQPASSNNKDGYVEPEEQSGWGNAIPDHILLQIFDEAVNQHGALPLLVNLTRVCHLWRNVSLHPKLWHTMDLSSWTKEKTEFALKKITATHLRHCKEVNLADWKVTNVECVLGHLLTACPSLEGICLAGWKNLTADHLTYLVDEFKHMKRLDLSSVNLELNPNRSAVGPTSLGYAIGQMGKRLTHLNLSHNRLAGIPQLISALAEHCPNLSLLDLSNVTTVAASHGILHIEQLQEGCPNLKVLRITNSQITLGPPPTPDRTLKKGEEKEPPGFKELEELSVASLADESRLMSDEFLWRILWVSSKLKLLDLRGCARLTHQTLIRLQTWDLKHLFLSGCSITRDTGSGLELIAEKWAKSLIELDLAWANVQEPLDNAIKAIAEKGTLSPLTHLNLCGSSVSSEAVKEILANCKDLMSINLASCRGLPRGVKRLMQGAAEIKELRDTLGVKVRFAVTDNRPFDDSQSQTPNSTGDIAEK